MPFRTQGLTIDSESEHWIAGEALPIDARASWTDGDAIAIVRELNSKGTVREQCGYEVNDLDSGGRGQRTRCPRTGVVSDSRAHSSLLDRKLRAGAGATRSLFLR